MTTSCIEAPLESDHRSVARAQALNKQRDRTLDDHLCLRKQVDSI